MSSFQHRETIASPTGARIALYSETAKAAPVGIVQINHGLAEHAARYARFAARLAEAGFHVYAHDHRGHGMTRAPDAPPGAFGKGPADHKAMADVLAVHDHIAGRHPDCPVILFGHSMGGLIGMRFVQEHSDRLAGAAIWNANFSTGSAVFAARAVLAWERFRLGSDTPSRILPRLTFRAWAKSVADRQTAFDWLSRDAAEVAAYGADPLCGCDPTIGLWEDVFRFMAAGRDRSRFAGVRRGFPFHLVGGRDDPATDGGKAVAATAKMLERIGFSNLETRLYPQTRHESLNDLNRDRITDDLVEWAAALVRRASGAG